MPRNYLRMLAALLFHTAVMFFLTYAAANSFSHLYLNLNRFYMASLMVSSMVIPMMMIMPTMYPNRTINLAAYSLSGLIILVAFFSIRHQALINDEQFLRSMIPHHSSAILMCDQAAISDPEIINLCQQIIASQQREINQMSQILRRLNSTPQPP